MRLAGPMLDVSLGAHFARLFVWCALTTGAVSTVANCAHTLPCVSDQILTAVGFEPTQLALVELESTPLDHSGKLS